MFRNLVINSLVVFCVLFAIFAIIGIIALFYIYFSMIMQWVFWLIIIAFAYAIISESWEVFKEKTGKK